MSLGHVLLVVAILLWMVLHYGLIVIALRDLSRRTVVRGGNPIAWWLIVLAIPIVGAVVYLMAGTDRPIPLWTPKARVSSSDTRSTPPMPS